MNIDSSTTPHVEVEGENAHGEVTTSSLGTAQESLETAPEALEAEDRECPSCTMMSPADSKSCWNCGFNFVTNKAFVPEVEPAKATQPAKVPASREQPTSDVSEQAQASSVASAPESGPATAETPVPVRRTLQPNPAAVVYAVEMPVQAPPPASPAAPTVTKLPAKVAAPVLSAASSSAVVGTPAPTSASPALGIEASALTIPAMDIVHPSTPHVVLVVDLEARRSRPSSEQTPPDRAPLVIPLTLEAHAFGRSIKACCLDFDRAASGLHGFFQQREDGGYSIRDESKNGTKLNGHYLDKGMATPLKDGDVITLGVWTKIVYWGGSPSQGQGPSEVAGDAETAQVPASDPATAQH